MSATPTPLSIRVAGAWARAALVVAWVAGLALQLRQPALWDGSVYRLLAAGALVLWLVARRLDVRGRPHAAHLGLCLAAAAAGFAWAGWRADLRLADALAPEWEGCDIEVVGTVDDMPQVADDGEHFPFVIESARAAGMSARDLKRVQALDRAAGRAMAPQVLAAEQHAARARGTDAGAGAGADTAAATGADTAANTASDAPGDAGPPLPPRAGSPVVPTRVWLAWSRNQRDDRAVGVAPAPLMAGQRWRLPVRLRRPHGAMNPGGFDAELWLFDQGLRATGTVRGEGQWLGKSLAPVANARQWVRDRLLLSGGAGDAAATGALAALAVGDQAAIAGPGWEVFRNTGVAHLMSISGLHITMLAWLGGALSGALWRRSERAPLRLATPVVARWGGVAVGWSYALLAGWGVPAQRTVVMLAATASLRGAGTNWPASLVALAAMVPVTLLDPWAVLQPGYWLSFAAVALLMLSEPARAADTGSAPAGAPALWGGGLHGSAPVVRGGAGGRGITDAGRAQGADGARGAHGADGADVAVEVSSAIGEDGEGVADGTAGPAVPIGPIGPADAPGDPGEPRPPRPDSPVSPVSLLSLRPARAAARARLADALAGVGRRVGGDLRSGVRAQLIASIGLAPLSLVAFQQVSLVGLVSNLVAEPWVTLVVTPLTLLGIALPPLWHVATLALAPLLWLLGWLARWPLASVHVATAPGWALGAGLAGGALLMLPLPWRVRLLGLPLLPPLLWPFVERPAVGRFELVAADVGQGTAVLVRTHAHLLLFDTGPRFGDDADAGQRMLLPLMQARGEPRIDTLLLSHADADHVGGAQSIIDRMPVVALRSSLAPDNPLRANALPHTPCLAGQSWTWDGVRFNVLHPFAADYRPGARTNAISCVLRVVDARGTSALLTGDVEAPGEARLVALARARPADPAAVLRSDVLVVPHHGSRTSSTDAFLEAVAPAVAVIQVGYRSRYGHPAPDVVARYAAHGIPVVRSDHCGAWTWSDGQARCARLLGRRYWQWSGAPLPLTPVWVPGHWAPVIDVAGEAGQRGVEGGQEGDGRPPLMAPIVDASTRAPTAPRPDPPDP